MGGKYYIHEKSKSEMFYPHETANYNYYVHDDADDNAICEHMFVSLDELIKNSDQKSYTIAELKAVLGKPVEEQYIDDEFFGGWYIKFLIGDYSLVFEGAVLNSPYEYAILTKVN